MGVRLKLMLLTVLVSTIPIAAIGIALIDINVRTLEQTNRELSSAVLDDIAASVDHSLQGVDTTLSGVAGALVDPTIQDDLRIPLAMQTVAASESVTAVGLYDESGLKIETIKDKDAPAVNFPDELPMPLRAAALGSEPAVGAVELTKTGPRALVARPIKGEGVTWVVAAYITLDVVQARVERIASARFAHAGSTIFVVDENLRAVAHSDPEYSETLSDLSSLPTLHGVTGASLRAGIALFGEFGEDDGTAVVGALQSLQRLPWAVGAEVPTSQAYKEVTRMRWIVGIVVVAAILISILAAGWLSGKITAPIRLLVKQTKDLAARRFNARVSIQTRDELAILGHALNEAAVELESSEHQLREELAIRSDLGRYLPSQIVEKIVGREQKVTLGGERREVTVLFADVAAFTPLAEAQAPEDVVTILNELFTVLTEVVFKHEGTVDKFIGDCVMAFWGAPSDQEDHARLAVSAAKDMLKWLEVANEHWAKKYGITIYLAIGVHTGDSIVGNFGSSTRMEYTAVGDTINVASRLESIARPQQILVSDATRQAAGSGFTFLSLGQQRLAGRVEPIDVHELRI